MSGGFFRGTSADQDTRFSNKQAKLLKSQKFPAELDHPVDTTKVKMDVIRPWIATRATELLGFEDEVLINFVYGLLEGKSVDGKHIHIQLTGFMEKNTGKFMKELWGLLLSAQNNASGVPQKFLDAKEEEMKKNKMETDRITQEIHKRKERGGWESEQDRKIRLDGLKEERRSSILNSDETLKDSSARSPSVEPKDEREVSRKDGSRRKSRTSYSPVRSSSKSFSKSRSYSEERHISRSPSVSPRHRKRSVSRGRQYRSPSKHSVSPRRIHRSPSRRRSPHFRRRSISRSRYRSPSSVRRRTPERRRSPLRRQFRSPSPKHRRSPTRRSPVYSRRKSPSPLQHRSSAGYQTSRRRRSPSLELRRSPSFRSPRRHSRSPARRKMDSNSPRHMNRSRSSPGSRSPNQRRRSLSKDTDSPANHLDTRRSRDDNIIKSPPVCPSDKKQVKLSHSGQREVDYISNKKSISLKSPQRDTKVSENEKRDDVDHKKWKYSPVKVSDSNKYSPGEVEAHRLPKHHETSIDMEKKSGQRSSNVNPSKKPRNQHSPMLEDIKNSPPMLSRESSLTSPERGVSPQYRRQSNQQSLFKSPSLKEGHFFEDKKQMYKKMNEYSSDIELNVKADNDIEEAAFHSNVEDDSRLRERKVERGAKMSSYEKEYRDAKDGSKMDEKECKRRKKDERRLRKEGKRRKREERHRRKEERRAGKKSKCVDTVNPPSDNDRGLLSADDTDSEARTRSTYRSDMDDAESRQKKLEIELREKALESLRAKKAINH